MNSLQKLLSRFREYRMSMRTRLTLGLGSIAAMLLLSSIISVLEYRRMSNYVTDLVADNIRNINVAQKLVSMSDEYNLKVLAAIGEEDSTSVRVPEFDRRAFMEQCDRLRTSISSKEAFPLADSVVYAYSAYMLTSLELPKVMASDFINSRDWYFDRLQPRYNRLRTDIERLTDAAYADLQANSMTFQDSFYRSIIPGVVSVAAGLVLVLLCGAELFTGNSLMVCALASKRISVRGLLRNWAIVWLGNFAGSLIVVALVYAAKIYQLNGEAVATTMVSLAAGKVTPDWLTLFARGVLCNVFVCLAVWIGFAGKTVVDKVAGILLPISAFVACGFEHCVANMFFLPMGACMVANGYGEVIPGASSLDIAGIAGNLIPVTLGNVVGGAVLVALGYWFAYGRRA